MAYFQNRLTFLITCNVKNSWLIFIQNRLIIKLVLFLRFYGITFHWIYLYYKLKFTQKQYSSNYKVVTMYINPSENVYKHGLVANKLIDYFTEK